MLPRKYVLNFLKSSHERLLNCNLLAPIRAIISVGVLSIRHFNGLGKILCQCIRIFRWSWRKGRSRWPPELVELVWHISLTSIVWLTLFVIVRYFLVMSNVLEVWPKGVRWQVWGVGGRHWRRVLTYRAASCDFRSNFNCDTISCPNIVAALLSLCHINFTLSHHYLIVSITQQAAASDIGWHYFKNSVSFKHAFLPKNL